MNCEIAQKLILLYDEQEYDPTKDVFPHLQQCAHCQKEWKTVQNIRKWHQNYQQNRGPAPLSLNFTEKIQQDIRSSANFYRNHPQLAWFRQQYFLQGAAAILVLAFLIQGVPYLLLTTPPYRSSKILTQNILGNQSPYWIKNSTPKPLPIFYSSPQIPYQLNQNKIVEEIHRKKNTYFIQSISTQNWTQGVPYVSIPIVPYSTSSPTDF